MIGKTAPFHVKSFEDVSRYLDSNFVMTLKLILFKLVAFHTVSIIPLANGPGIRISAKGLGSYNQSKEVYHSLSFDYKLLFFLQNSQVAHPKTPPLNPSFS